jgi:hypothetical protein
MYSFHRIFCATAWELEGERRAFYDVVGEFNAGRAMPDGILYTPITLTNIRDKRPYQYTVDENIRQCHGYLLAVSDGWGPSERNFEPDYLLARQCLADPSLPMQHVAVITRNLPGGDPSPFAAQLAASGIPSEAFSTPEDFKALLTATLARWHESFLAKPA